jgi:hypothetical protein
VGVLDARFRGMTAKRRMIYLTNFNSKDTSIIHRAHIRVYVSLDSAVRDRTVPERRNETLIGVGLGLMFNGHGQASFRDYDLVALGIADANLTHAAFHGPDFDPTIDETLSNRREVIYLNAKVLDAAAVERLFWGEL